MVSALKPFKATSQVNLNKVYISKLTPTTTKDTTLRSRYRFYPASGRRPVYKTIHAQKNARDCVPLFDVVFAEKQKQPVIHDCVVTVVYRRRATQLHIFVKNHKRLQQNNVVRNWQIQHLWRGDIAVCRKGCRKAFVNLRGGDASIADYAVKR